MLTILEGSSFLVADDLGNVTSGSEGLYANDTRYLSRWRVLVDERVPLLLSVGSAHYASGAVYAQCTNGTASHPSPLAVVRELFIGEESLQERLVLENHSAETVPALVRYEFDSDFLDLFEVKTTEFGERDLAFAKTITPLFTSRAYDADERVYTFTTLGDGFGASCLLWFSQEGIPGDREVNFEVELGPHASWSLQAHVVMLFDDDERERAYPSEWFGRERERLEGSLRAWQESTPTLTGSLERIDHVYRRSLADLAALRTRRRESPHRRELIAAGLPWFMTVFGRDTLLVSLQTMPLGDGLARAALEVLGGLQATDDDPTRDAEPGKILHELRSGKVARLGGQFPYYGSVDSTPLYLIALSEVWRWSGDDSLPRELEQVARRAVEWLERHGDLDGDGFLEFHRRAPRGLEVQTWKDSWDSMQFADGTLARSPIAPAEVQGYAYDARLRTAELARAVWHDDELAARLERDAALLRERFDEAFWIERDGHGYYALALDRDKRPVDALSSNAGHLLWTGIAREERLPGLVRLLFGERMWSGWGVRTLATTSTGYNPIGYHTGSVWPHDNSFVCWGLANHGFAEEATRIATSQVEAAEHFGWRLPEVIAGYERAHTGFPVQYPTACSPQAWAAGAPILCLRAILGLEPDAATRSLRVAPRLPPDADTVLEWSGVHAFGQRWDVSVRGDEASVEPAP